MGNCIAFRADWGCITFSSVKVLLGATHATASIATNTSRYNFDMSSILKSETVYFDHGVGECLRRFLWQIVTGAATDKPV
jgi:hypothetical protein